MGDDHRLVMDWRSCSHLHFIAQLRQFYFHWDVRFANISPRDQKVIFNDWGSVGDIADGENLYKGCPDPNHHAELRGVTTACYVISAAAN